MAWLSHPFVREKTAQEVASNLRQHLWVGLELERARQQQAAALAGMGRPSQFGAADGSDGEAASLLVPAGSDDDADGGGSSSEAAGPSAVDGAEGGSSSSNATSGSNGTAAGGAAAPLSASDAARRLFATRVWREDAPIDDALTTLMQWLHFKMLHPYDAARAHRHQRQRSSQQRLITK
jgi:hypothetical protein